MPNAKNILIVDDNPDAAEFVKAVISVIGNFTVSTAYDGNSGLEKAKTEKPDLIILDVVMPGKDGFMVFSDLRKIPETENIPVVMLTGISAETGVKFGREDMGECIGKEPEEFLDKPVDPKRLHETILRIFNK